MLERLQNDLLISILRRGVQLHRERLHLHPSLASSSHQKPGRRVFPGLDLALYPRLSCKLPNAPSSPAVPLPPRIKMATIIIIIPISPKDLDPANVPLMTLPTPRSESLITALHPLIVCVLLLYLLPGLFSDYTAQAVWETYHLDTFIASGLCDTKRLRP